MEDTTFKRWFDVLSNVLGGAGVGVAGLVVVWLTLKLEETRIRKLFFILAGGGGAGILITAAVFDLLSLLGHKPSGDGGGITVPMLLLCAASFLIGAVGSIVCLIKGRKTKDRNTP